MTIAVDLDGCLAQAQEPYDQLTIGEAVPEAVTLLRIWMAAGHTVIIHTCRAQEGKYLDDAYDLPQRMGVLQRWLTANELGGVLVWMGRGKPDADLYLDDRARQVSADDPASWQRAENVVRLLASAQNGGAR